MALFGDHTRKSFLITTLLTAWSIFPSCKKLVTVGSPNTALTSENIYSNDATAASVLTGIYASLSTPSPLYGSSLTSISLAAGLSADELILFGGAANQYSMLVQYYLNRLVSGSSSSAGGSIWSDCYSKLYVVNIALERLAVSTTLTPSVRNHLIGEAKFLRAFFFFYLTTLYGDIPLTISSDYTVNSTLSRKTQSLVFKQIINDLRDAQNFLSDGYVGPDALSSTSERTRPNKWVATALLARAYLYNKAYDSAEIAASSVIANSNLYHLTNLNKVFLANSSEAIWQLQPVNIGWNTLDAQIFVLPPTGPNNNGIQSKPVYLSDELLAAFEPGDARRVAWIDSVIAGKTYYYPYKYKSDSLNAPITEYLMVLRLAELYLIRAEARAHKNDLSSAVADLDTLRGRAHLPYLSVSDPSSILAAVQHERQVELFTEWGHRWLDLKRDSAINPVMGAPGNVAVEKGSTWDPNWQWYPVPAYDILQDSKLTQNSGY